MLTKKKSAGDRLREEMNAALVAAAKAAGKSALEFTEHEAASLDRACFAADRAEHLRELYTRLQADPETSPTLLVKVSAEIRSLDHLTITLLERVQPEPGRAKSSQHQRAARNRWDIAR